LDLLLYLFTALPFTVSRHLCPIPGDFKFLAKLQALLITSPLHSVELLLGKMAGGLKLRFLKKECLDAVLRAETVLPEFLLDLTQLRLETIFPLGVQLALDRDLPGELVTHLVQKILQEGRFRLREHKSFFDTSLSEVQSILLVDLDDLLQGCIKLAEVKLATRERL
jgi:hypothetical protein